MIAHDFRTLVPINNILWVPRNRAYEYSATYTPVTYVYIYFWIKDSDEMKNFKSKFGPLTQDTMLPRWIVFSASRHVNEERTAKKKMANIKLEKLEKLGRLST